VKLSSRPNKAQQEFLNLLFNESEWVVIANDPKGVKSFKGQNRPEGVYFGINPVYPSTTRRNANVRQFRHFLVEFDSGTVAEQLEIMEKSGIPYKTAVFSGNKSVHFIIALDKPLGASGWRDLLSRIHMALPSADSACKAGCQLSRLPKLGGHLIRQGRNTNFKELDSLLPKLPEKKACHPKRYFNSSHGLTRRTIQYVTMKSHKTTGHADSLHAAKNMLEVGMSPDDVLSMLIRCRQRYCPDQPVHEIEHKAAKALSWVLNEWDDTQ
jgi:hypothetical protein